MWFSVTLWTLLASLVCLASCSSSSLYPAEEDYDKTDESRWADYDKDLGPWTDLTRRHTLDTGNTAEAFQLVEGVGVAGGSIGKRESHSLSIVNPLDVLRQRLMLEMARRRMKENQEQIRENAIILKSIGRKRAAPRRRPHHGVSNSEDFEV